MTTTHSFPTSRDARPSDGIAIALRLDAPLFVQDALLTADDDEADEATTTESLLATPPGDEMTTEQLKAYLATLRPEDFGKFTP